MNRKFEEDISFDMNNLGAIDNKNISLPQFLNILKAAADFPFRDDDEYFSKCRHCLDLCECKINQCGANESLKMAIKNCIDEIIGFLVESFAANTLFDRLPDVDQVLCVFRRYVQLFGHAERRKLLLTYRKRFEQLIMNMTNTADYGTQLHCCELLLELSAENMGSVGLLVEIFKYVYNVRFEEILKVVEQPAPKRVQRNRIKLKMTEIICSMNEKPKAGPYIFDKIHVTFNGKPIGDYLNLFSGHVAFNTDGQRLTFHFDTISSEYESPMIVVPYKNIINLENATSFCHYTKSYFRFKIKSPMAIIYSKTDVKNELQQRIQKITEIEMFFSDISNHFDRLTDAYQTTYESWKLLNGHYL